MPADLDPSRRHLLHSGAVAVAAATGLIVVAPAAVIAADEGEGGEGGGEEVTPSEDLMREHGVLKRVMLAYDEITERLRQGRDFPPDALAGCAGIIRHFIEDYHEKLEEDFLFPRFERANKLTELVKVLRAQHQAGRRVTDVVIRHARPQDLKDADTRAKVLEAIHQFNRMYAPHEAREDTVLFPALRSVVSAHEYAALGEDFEKKEHEMLGKEGFEGMVEKVAGIEKSLGIYDLAKFTPKGV